MRVNLKILVSCSYWVVAALACASCIQQTGLSQTGVADSDARGMLDAPVAEQQAYVQSVLDRSFPDAEGDKFALLLVNRSAVVVPLLEARVLELLKEKPSPNRTIDLASAMIAYAGDEDSLKAISRLLGVDESRFGSLVGLTLYNSMNWRNPFTVAYRAVDLGDEAVSKLTLQWSDEVLSTDKMKRLWAEALVEKYGGPPKQSDWDRDPIASRLEPARCEQLREGVLRFATEAAAKRKTSQ